MERHENSTSWPAAIAARVGERVKKYRAHAGLSAQGLSDRTAQLGYEVKRSVIAEMENGKRATVPLADVLVLARALSVPPVLLMYPVDSDEPVEVLPGQTVDVWAAIDWTLGTLNLQTVAPWVDEIAEDRAEHARWLSESKPLALRAEHRRTTQNRNGHNLWADVYQRQADAATESESERLKTLALRETELAARSMHALAAIDAELHERGIASPDPQEGAGQ